MTDVLPEEELVTVSIPLDSNIIAQPPIRTEITLSTALEFEQFYSVICDAMEVPPSRANLGYRFSWEPIRVDHRRFGTADDFRAIIVQMLKKMRAARTVTPVLWIYNEVRHLHPVTPPIFECSRLECTHESSFSNNFNDGNSSSGIIISCCHPDNPRWDNCANA